MIALSDPAHSDSTVTAGLRSDQPLQKPMEAEEHACCACCAAAADGWPVAGATLACCQLFEDSVANSSNINPPAAPAAWRRPTTGATADRPRTPRPAARPPACGCWDFWIAAAPPLPRRAASAAPRCAPGTAPDSMTTTNRIPGRGFDTLRFRRIAHTVLSIAALCQASPQTAVAPTASRSGSLRIPWHSAFLPLTLCTGADY